MHAALRQLDDALPATLDLNGWDEAPAVTAVTFSNLDLPATKDTDAQHSVDAIMLEGYTHPLYKLLRPLKYYFVRGVHGHDGVNRWVRVISEKESGASLVREVCAMLEDNGWDVE